MAEGQGGKVQGSGQVSNPTSKSICLEVDAMIEILTSLREDVQKAANGVKIAEQGLGLCCSKFGIMQRPFGIRF